MEDVHKIVICQEHAVVTRAFCAAASNRIIRIIVGLHFVLPDLDYGLVLRIITGTHFINTGFRSRNAHIKRINADWS